MKQTTSDLRDYGMNIKKKEPVLLKAGDQRVLINGYTSSVDFRIVSEDYYRGLVKADKIKELIEKYEDAIIECNDQIHFKEIERTEKPFYVDVINAEIRRNSLEVKLYERFIENLTELEATK